MNVTQPFTPPPDVIKLLAHDLRWGLLKALAESDRRVQELVDMFGQPMNLVSYHLGQLRRDHLVLARRSEADGRDVYYSLDLPRLGRLLNAAARALHPALAGPSALPADRAFPGRAARVLFICTSNSARSQMAEALLRHAAGDRVEVYSAGSDPAPIRPEAIAAMDALGLDIRSQQPKGFAQFAAAPFDYVITVCDRAREVCPTFSGNGRQFHWGVPDPAAIADDAARARAFAAAAQQLKTRITCFLAGLNAEEAMNDDPA